MSFSVVIPLYNNEKTVARALRSVLGQTYQEFEVIVVNDGSTDESVREVEQFRDPRIRIVHQANAGVSAARNRGIAEAACDIVAFLDADDEWLADFLCVISNLAHDFASCGVFATGYYITTSAGEQRHAQLGGPPARAAGLLTGYAERLLRGDPPFFSSSVAARKGAMDGVGGFPVGIRAGEDILTWFKLSTRSEIAFDPAPHAVYQAPLPGERRVRTPPNEDPVREHVAAFVQSAPSLALKQTSAFLAYWYRVRAMTFLAAGSPGHARSFALKSFRQRATLRPLVYVLLSFLPQSVCERWTAGLRQMLNTGRFFRNGWFRT